MRARLTLALSLGLAAAAVLGVDHLISDGRQIGWERNSVRNSRTRWAGRPNAKIAIFGSSTSKDWLPSAWLARQLGERGEDVLDAHINGCHQGCTWAEVRRFVAEGRRFDTVFVGTNLFQLCEFPHTKRVLQQQLMVPPADVPALLAIHAKGETPLQAAGRLLGASLLGAYGDTAAVRARLEKAVYRDADPRARAVRRHNSWRWARRTRIKKPTAPLSCAYGDDDVALKRAFSEGLLDDLSTLADRVYLMVLPDRTLSLKTPEHAERWAKHLALHRALAEARPKVVLLDLVTDGAASADLFRDGFHLNEEGMRAQRTLFARRLKAAEETR